MVCPYPDSHEVMQAEVVRAGDDVAEFQLPPWIKLRDKSQQFSIARHHLAVPALDDVRL